MLKVAILIIAAFVSIIQADDDGQYKPELYNSNGEDGRYIPDDSGLYIPDNSGLYNADGSGKYNGINGRYQGDANRYVGSKDRYSDKVIYNQNLKYRIPSSIATPTAFPSIQPIINLIPDGTYQTKQISILPKSVGAGGSGNIVSDLYENYGDKSAAATFGSPRVFTNPRFSGEKYNQGKYDDSRWRIIKQSGDVGSDGYQWEYETENGITAEESGVVANKGSDAEAMRSKGFYKYTGPDNVVYTVTYTADENGFVASGNHLPTPPPIPVAILKSLEFNRATGKL